MSLADPFRAAHNFSEEINDRGVSVPRCRLAHHFTLHQVQGCIQRQNPILPMSFCAAQRHRYYSIQAIQCLATSLLLYEKQVRTPKLQGQPNDVRRFRVELPILPGPVGRGVRRALDSRCAALSLYTTPETRTVYDSPMRAAASRGRCALAQCMRLKRSSAFACCLAPDFERIATGGNVAWCMLSQPWKSILRQAEGYVRGKRSKPAWAPATDAGRTKHLTCKPNRFDSRQ